MPDPVALGAAAAPSAADAASPTATAQQLDPAETRMFARMMQDAPLPDPVAGGSLQDAAKAYAAQLGGHVRSYEDMRRTMLESIDLTDPVKTMFSLTDHSMQAQMMFARLHISTALASSATSLFGTLLRNQQ
jgi:hypothetical protein